MLYFECVDKKGDTIDNLVELCFTDEDGDEAIKIIISENSATNMAKEIMKQFSWAAKKRKQS